MRKKSAFKITTVVVVFAFICLASPMKTRANPKFDFNHCIKKPIAFLASLFSSLPIYDLENYINLYTSPSKSKFEKKAAVAGYVLKGRPSGGD